MNKSTLAVIKQTLDSVPTGPTGRETSRFSSSTYRGQNMWYFGNDGTEFKFQYSGHESSLKAYRCCPPVTAIINKKAQAFVNGKTWILDKEGNEAQTIDATKLRKLLARPNALQTWRQFEAQAYIYSQVFGYSVLLPIKPVGYTRNIDAGMLWNIPPYMVDIEETKKLFYQDNANGIIKKVVINLNGLKTELNADEVYFIKDFSPSFDSPIIPESRIRPLEMPINNIIGSLESRNVLINYRGALGILTPEKDQFGIAPVDSDYKEILQGEFSRYGLSKRQWKFIISEAALKWQPMGVPTKDLMLFEEMEDDIMRVCDGLNFPFPLMSNTRNNNLGGSNTDPNHTLLYQGAILPEADNFYEQLNHFFGLEELGLRLDKDYKHISALQGDQVKEATARLILNQALKIQYENGLISKNQWLIALGDNDMGPEGDVKVTDTKNQNVPLASIIGVGGVQSVIQVLTDAGLSQEARAASLNILFNISPEDAARMSIAPEASQTQPTA